MAEKDEEEEAEESEECAVPVCHDGRRCSGPMFILPGFVAARFDIGRGASLSSLLEFTRLHPSRSSRALFCFRKSAIARCFNVCCASWELLGSSFSG